MFALTYHRTIRANKKRLVFTVTPSNIFWPFVCCNGSASSFQPRIRGIEHVMRYRKCTVATLLILGFSYGRLISGRTPSWVGTRGGHQRTSQRRKSLNDTAETTSSAGGGIHDRGTSEQGRPNGEALARPSRIYKVLAKHFVGRYVLATSSLFGECARVYVPSSVGLIALSICGQVGFAMDSDGRHRGDSARALGSQPGLSYDQFLSQHHSTEDEELSAEAAAVPPEKYGRVSPTFLARHAIGREENSKENVSDEKVPFEPSMQVGRERSEDYYQGPGKITSVKVAGRSPQSMSESRFLKSLAGMRKAKPRGVGDDLDLLSDVDDVDFMSNVIGAKSVGRKGLLVTGRYDVSPRRVSVNRSESDPNLVLGRDPRYEGSITEVVDAGPRSNANARNLVSGADDSASALISKLRASQKKIRSGALKSEGTRKSKKTRRSNEVPHK